MGKGKEGRDGGEGGGDRRSGWTVSKNTMHATHINTYNCMTHCYSHAYAQKHTSHTLL